MQLSKQYTNPPSALGFWIPLEPCTAENGALSFLPGSHKTNKLTKRFVRLQNGGTGFEPLPATAYTAPENTSGTMFPMYCLLECNPGDIRP